MSRTSSCVLLLSAACLVVLTAESSFAQTVLRWQFKQGQVLNQLIEQDMRMSMKVGAQNINTAMRQTSDVVWKMGDVDAQGAAQVVQQFNRVRMKLEAPGGAGFDFDSSKDQELTGMGAMMAPALKALAKAEFSMKMTPQGEIEDVEVSQATADALQQVAGAQQLGGTFTKDGIVNMLKQARHIFPKGAVQRGDSWTSELETDLAQLGKMIVESRLTYVGPEEVEGKSLERINIDAAVKIVPKGGDGAGPQITLKNQKASGALYFDNAAGRMSHSTLVQNMTLQIMMGENSMDQTIDQTINVRMTPSDE